LEVFVAKSSPAPVPAPVVRSKVERVTLPIEKLVPAPYNPRAIKDEAMEGLKTSLDRFGLVQEIVVNKRTMHIVGGDKRVKALKEMGATEVPVCFVDLTDAEEKALNVTLNNPMIQGEFTGDLQKILDECGGQDLLKGLRMDELKQSLEAKLQDTADEFKREFALEELHVAPPPKMVWSLVAVPTEIWPEVAQMIEALGKTKGVMLDTVVR
jgi:hypothetical protein